MANCPSEEQLAVYAAEGPDADPAGVLAAHVKTCPRCQEWLRQEQDDRAWLTGLRAINSGGLPKDADRSAETAAANQDTWDETAAPASNVAGPQVEGYELLRELKHGGQAVVFLAVQKSTKRKVAIKFPLEGQYASATARRRFEREIELIAQLKHPNIIAIYHAGQTADGRPFYVMDYVRGLPLNRYVREKKLTVEKTLRLFATVCDAVQYAHQRGVIHRDLKPTNILVDADGSPKVLDFGLAKVLAAPVETAFSITQELIGTLPYMSPEQTTGNPDEVDTRSDVYALGVILYELLTGQYPYPVVGNVVEVLRSIADTPPTPPVRKWTVEAGIAQRSSGRRGLGACPIDDEVQTIVLKALAKDRARRYQGAGELARDIDHHLAGEPIEAKRDSGWYVLKKSLRRHRTAARASVAILIVIVSALLTTTTLWYKAVRAQDSLAAALSVTDATWKRGLREVRLADMVRLSDDLQVQLGRTPISARAVVENRLEQANDVLLQKLNRALATNHLAEVEALFGPEQPAGQTDVKAVLLDINKRRPEENIKERLCKRLEGWLRVPPPMGHGQEMRNALRMLHALAPDSQKIRKTEAATDALCRTPKRVYSMSEDFESRSDGAIGRITNRWGSEDPKVVTLAGHQVKGLLVQSNSRNSSQVELDLAKLPAPCGPYSALVVRCTLNAAELPATKLAPNDYLLEFVLCAHDNAGLAGVLLSDTELRMYDAGRIVSRRISLRLNQALELELRYFPERGTYDVIVDEEFLLEEGQSSQGRSAAILRMGSAKGTSWVVEDLEVYYAQAPLKRLLGEWIPVWTGGNLLDWSMEAVSRLDIQSSGILVHDFDGDGYCEIAAGGHTQTDELCFYKANSWLSLERQDCMTGLSGQDSPRPVGTVGPLLGIVYGLEFPYQQTAIMQEQLGFFEFKLGSKAQDVFARTFCSGTPALDIHCAPWHTNREALGFVVGTDSSLRIIELYQPTSEDPGAARFRRIGRYAPIAIEPGSSRGGHGIPSDVYSIVPCDSDGDGVDDLLFLGLGPWHGYCPAVIELPVDNTRVLPVQDTAMPDDVCADEADCLSLAVQPLMAPAGPTRLALWNPAPANGPYLIATSGADPTTRPDWDFPEQRGVRVWRVREVQKNATTPAAFPLIPGDVRAVTVGRIRDREVFATARIEDFEGLPDRQNLILAIYGMSEGSIELLWEATIFDVPQPVLPQTDGIQFGDLDGNGTDELLVHFVERGVLVLAHVQPE